MLKQSGRCLAIPVSYVGTRLARIQTVSFHRFPSDLERRASWFQAFGIDESQLKSQSRVCCRHFRDGDAKNEPLASLGKRFASPIKGKHPRAKRAKTRESAKELTELRSSRSPVCLSRSVTPSEAPLTVSAGEQWETDYQVHELPSGSTGPTTSQKEEVLVNTALLLRIEALEAENTRLRARVNQPRYFRIKDIQDNDRLICIYTGFGDFDSVF